MAKRGDVFTKLGKLGEDDSREDYELWEKLGPDARFKAAWDLVKDAHIIRKGNPDELRFQRSVENLIRKGS